MAAEAHHEARRPNVILLMTDQHRADALGCMGNVIVQTPNFDRLAASGVVFEQAFVQCPVCMASRGAIHTGRYPRTIRIPSMGILPPDEITLAESLKRAGYATGLFGKLHLTPEGYTRDRLKSEDAIDDVRPFLEPTGILSAATKAASEDPFKQNYGFGTSVGINDNNWGRYLDWLREVAPEHVRHFVSENWGLPHEGTAFGRPPAKRLFHTLVSDLFDSHLPAEVHPSVFIVEKTLEFVRENRGQPFFAHVSFVDPHHPFNAPRPYRQMYPVDEMSVPREFDRARCFPPGLPEGVAKVIEKRATYPPELFQWALANYYGMISHIDWCVGQLLGGLGELDALDNTLIVFVSDHGEYVGDHGLLYKGALLFDGLIRVPLVFTWGDELQSGRRVKAMVQSIDIYPTIMSLVALPIHPGVQGRDLSDVLRGGPEVGYERVTCELDDLPDRQYAAVYAIRSEDWKLTYFPRARTGMLFNLKDDPGELHNLYFDAAHSQVRHELTNDFLDHLYASKDPLPIRLSQA